MALPKLLTVSGNLETEIYNTDVKTGSVVNVRIYNHGSMMSSFTVSMGIVNGDSRIIREGHLNPGDDNIVSKLALAANSKVSLTCGPELFVVVDGIEEELL